MHSASQNITKKSHCNRKNGLKWAKKGGQKMPKKGPKMAQSLTKRPLSKATMLKWSHSPKIDSESNRKWQRIQNHPKMTPAWFSNGHILGQFHWVTGEFWGLSMGHFGGLSVTYRSFGGGLPMGCRSVSDPPSRHTDTQTPAARLCGLPQLPASLPPPYTHTHTHTHTPPPRLPPPTSPSPPPTSSLKSLSVCEAI